jgi:hypothetical protein
MRVPLINSLAFQEAQIVYRFILQVVLFLRMRAIVPEIPQMLQEFAVVIVLWTSTKTGFVTTTMETPARR